MNGSNTKSSAQFHPSPARSALVMAGGRSERMRATTGRHKALMELSGKTLLEWNLQALFDEGFTEVHISTSIEHPDIEAFVATRGLDLASAAKASLTCMRETTPLGTIGAARNVPMADDALLVVNVDNITLLPLRGLMEHHQVCAAALTVASHVEPFRIPFGQLLIHDGYIAEYREKPALPVQISSGTYVLGKAALDLIPSSCRFDIPQLFAAVKSQRLRVAAFQHASAWIDVNDEQSLQRAEDILVGRSGAGAR